MSEPLIIIDDYLSFDHLNCFIHYTAIDSNGQKHNFGLYERTLLETGTPGTEEAVKQRFRNRLLKEHNITKWPQP